ncbi:MAG: hypothetical protein V3S42_04535 [Candidatus Neomarinimicrobiota bacterium]
MIAIEVEGSRFEGFTTASVTKSLDTLSGSFSFDATKQQLINLPFSVGQACQIFVQDKKIITGFIDIVSVNYSRDEHLINIQGRDKTSDVIDSTIGESVEFTGNISLAEIITMTLSNVGISGINVTDSVGTLDLFNGSEIESGEVGESVFDFIERLARKRQVLLNSDGDGNIVISRSSSQIVDETIVNQENSGNILSGTISYNSTNRFNRYIVRSQDNNTGLSLFGKSVDQEKSYNRKGESIDEDIRDSRVLNVIAGESYTDNDSLNRAKWEQNIRRVQSTDYSAVVQGFFRGESNEIWQENVLVQIKDSFAGLNGIMLLNSLNYSFSIDSGSRTTLNFIDRDAYKIEADKPAVTKRSNSLGLGFLK